MEKFLPCCAATRPRSTSGRPAVAAASVSRQGATMGQLQNHRRFPGSRVVAGRAYNPDPALVATYVFDPAKIVFKDFPICARRYRPNSRLAGFSPRQRRAGLPEFSRDAASATTAATAGRSIISTATNGAPAQEHCIMTGEYCTPAGSSTVLRTGRKIVHRFDEHVWQFDDLTGWKKIDVKPTPPPGDCAERKFRRPAVCANRRFHRGRRTWNFLVSRSQLFAPATACTSQFCAE